jgi:anti-sigma factor RsiW
MSDEHPSLERLNEYLDSDLDPRERREVEQHLVRCPECRQAADGLAAVVRAAFELEEVAPPARAWESIASSLRGRKAPASNRPLSLRGALALAATLVLGVSLWLAIRAGEREAPAGASELAEMVARELLAAESHYGKAIEGLEQIVAQNQGVLPEELAAELGRNLVLIDTAIHESRSAIAAKPQSPAAQQSLLQALRSKVTLLQNTILLINEVRKGQGENALDLIEEMRSKAEPGNPI